MPVVARLALSDGREGQEVDLRQHIQCLADDDRDVLVVYGAGAFTVARKVLGDCRQMAAAAFLHSLNVGLAHFSNPAGVAAENADPLVTGAAGTGLVEDIKVGAEEHVDADGGELLSDDTADLFGRSWDQRWRRWSCCSGWA